MRYVAYYRVSTAEQGRSGLGLAAQREAVAAYVAKRPGGELMAEHEEVMSGGKRTRPGLAAALEQSKRAGATLIVAKLDRLSRDAELVLRLVNSGVGLVFLDLPDADTSSPVGRLVVTVMAALAEFERGRIGERIREAVRHMPEDKHPGKRSAREALERYKAEGGAELVELMAAAPAASTRELTRQLAAVTGRAWDHGTVGRMRRALAVV